MNQRVKAGPVPTPGKPAWKRKDGTLRRSEINLAYDSFVRLINQALSKLGAHEPIPDSDDCYNVGTGGALHLYSETHLDDLAGKGNRNAPYFQQFLAAVRAADAKIKQEQPGAVRFVNIRPPEWIRGSATHYLWVLQQPTPASNGEETPYLALGLEIDADLMDEDDVGSVFLAPSVYYGFGDPQYRVMLQGMKEG